RSNNDCLSAGGALIPDSLPKEPIVDDNVPINAWQGPHLLGCAWNTRPFVWFEIVLDAGGRVINHVFAVEFALPEESF
ncbi:MAG: hypothetical protein VX572_10670, partial [Chloroflexota bacterium]|nr:hypothetical protein [Chloroflexota bacterium]